MLRQSMDYRDASTVEMVVIIQIRDITENFVEHDFESISFRNLRPENDTKLQNNVLISLD